MIYVVEERNGFSGLSGNGFYKIVCNIKSTSSLASIPHLTGPIVTTTGQAGGMEDHCSTERQDRQGYKLVGPIQQQQVGWFSTATGIQAGWSTTRGIYVWWYTTTKWIHVGWYRGIPQQQGSKLEGPAKQQRYKQGGLVHQQRYKQGGLPKQQGTR